jgi:Uncharacterised nucleotidyltransferase
MSDRFSSLGGYRLAPDQELLLQATLLEGSGVQRAWDQWRSLIDIEVVESSSHALLPQLYQNLLTHGVEDPHMARLKGIYRRNWYADRLQLDCLKILLSQLKSAGIEAIVLGEAARYHPKNCRPISSLQLLVRAEELEGAAAKLTGLNWRVSNSVSQIFIQLKDDRDRSLHLQGHLFWAIPQADTDQLVWQYATPIDDELAGWRLSPADQLLDLCSRTFYQSKSPQIAGIADALRLIQHSGDDLDWMRLIDQAQRYQMILPVRNMLTLLDRVLHLSAPSWVLPALSQMPIHRSEWLKYQVLSGDRQSSIRSIVARSSSHLETKWIALRYKPFPGRGVLKSLLKPTRSVLKLGE